MSRILIAEADAGVASRLQEALESAGYLTEHADDGETALILARAAGFDRIILAADLPLLGGPEVLARIRSEGVTTPAIVLAADEALNDSDLHDAATRLLPPSFRVRELLDLVRGP